MDRKKMEDEILQMVDFVQHYNSVLKEDMPTKESLQEVPDDQLQVAHDFIKQAYDIVLKEVAMLCNKQLATEDGVN